ncbi:hypothetical protein HZS_8051, partial [Henneguya salminicola]
MEITNTNINKLKEVIKIERLSLKEKNEKEIIELYFLLRSEKTAKKIVFNPEKSDIFKAEIEKEQLILDQIEELKSTNSWRLSKKLASYTKIYHLNDKQVHRDYMLNEMRWLATDFAQEYRWKKKIARTLVKNISKLHCARLKSQLIEQKKDKRITSFISKCIQKFWQNARDRLYIIKHKYESANRIHLLKNSIDSMVNTSENLAHQLVHQIDNLDEETDDKNYARELNDLQTQNQMSIDEILSSLPQEYASRYKRKMTPDKSNDNQKISPKVELYSGFEKISENVANYLPENCIEISNSSIKEPPLMRHKLRSYQLVGLKWLLTLHNNNLNGILADEMGLGKTIQTIALLSHLAEPEGIWGPHLIIVPSSVIVNWEMEIRKWCPSFKVLAYYGTSKERKQKRKGWSGLYHFHICITSYNIAIQDYKIFKRKSWYYLILDEAQNIKNFKTQRWQLLVSLNTQRRLLLSGTPLQNDLIELWSLLNFVMPTYFNDQILFKDIFSKSINDLIQSNGEYDHDLIDKFHKILRPFILRRLKNQVEFQLPKKYERLIKCKLSRRQRSLYDQFMNLDQTKHNLYSAQMLSILQIILKLRKVCNHPDLFEARPVISPFIPSSPIIYRVPSLILDTIPDLNIPSSLLFIKSEWDPLANIISQVKSVSKCEILDLFDKIYQFLSTSTNDELKDSLKICNCHYNCACLFYADNFTHPLFKLLRTQSSRFSSNDVINECKIRLLKTFLTNLCHSLPTPLYGDRLRKIFTFPSNLINSVKNLSFYHHLFSIILNCLTVSSENDFQKFVCTTPKVFCTSSIIMESCSPRVFNHPITYQSIRPFWPLHISRLLLIPDNRLIQYDCGKLQELDNLLTYLKASNHRVLIFTQMSKMLDILEKFLSYHSYRYLRLDGSTKIKDRHFIGEKFNNDSSIFCLILSTRTGGIGMNLTGADTVIFYDNDWNPSADLQAQDRCHRIGQTKDVYIYRLVCENTIEENILDRANRKKLLNEIAIENAEFTAKALNESTIKSLFFEKTNIFEDKEQIFLENDDQLDTKNIQKILTTVENEDKLSSEENSENSKSKHQITYKFFDHENVSLKSIHLFAMRKVNLMEDKRMDIDIQLSDEKKLFDNWNTTQKLESEAYQFCKQSDELPPTTDLFYDYFTTEQPDQKSLTSNDEVWSFNEYLDSTCQPEKIKPQIDLTYNISRAKGLFLSSYSSDKSDNLISALSESISPPTVENYFSDLKNINEKTINWSFIGHVLDESHALSQITPKVFKKRHASLNPVSLETILHKPFELPPIKSTKKLSTIPNYFVKNDIISNPVYFDINLMDKFSNTDLPPFQLDPQLTPLKIYDQHIKISQEKTRQLEERTTILSTQPSGPSITSQNIQNLSTSTSYSVTPNISYPHNLTARLSAVQPGSLRPSVRLVTPRQLFDAGRRFDTNNTIRNEALKVAQSKDGTQRHQYLRLSTINTNLGSSSTQNQNPILNASTLNLYSNNGNIIRGNQLNINQSSIQGTRQLFIQTQRQITPQLQTTQSLRHNLQNSASSSKNISLPCSINSPVQNARNIVSSQIQNIQRHHNRQVINAHRLLSTTTNGSTINPYRGIVLPPQSQQQFGAVSTVPHLTNNDFHKTIIRMSRPSENISLSSIPISQ